MKGFLYVYENQLHLLILQIHLSLQLLLPIIKEFLKCIIKYMISFIQKGLLRVSVCSTKPGAGEGPATEPPEPTLAEFIPGLGKEAQTQTFQL